jgi:hypothetical protein
MPITVRMGGTAAMLGAEPEAAMDGLTPTGTRSVANWVGETAQALSEVGS